MKRRLPGARPSSLPSNQLSSTTVTFDISVSLALRRYWKWYAIKYKYYSLLYPILYLPICYPINLLGCLCTDLRIRRRHQPHRGQLGPNRRTEACGIGYYNVFETFPVSYPRRTEFYRHIESLVCDHTQTPQWRRHPQDGPLELAPPIRNPTTRRHLPVCRAVSKEIPDPSTGLRRTSPHRALPYLPSHWKILTTAQCRAAVDGGWKKTKISCCRMI